MTKIDEYEKELKAITLRYANELSKERIKLEINCNRKINMVKLSYTVYE